MSACSYRGVESILRHRLDETAAEPLARTERSTTKFTRWSTNEGHPNRCSRTGKARYLIVKRQRKDYYTGDNYLHARDEAFERSKGMCQLCGCRKATVAHHHATEYPPPEAVTGNDFTALCQTCHNLTHYATFVAEVGLSEIQLLEALSKLFSKRFGMPIGRPRGLDNGKWGALVFSIRQPDIGDTVMLYLKKQRTWKKATVTAVIEGQPGNWLVRQKLCKESLLSQPSLEAPERHTG